jgi:hypothetical protein
MSERPIFLHTIPGQTAYEAVTNPELLSANSIQTGHSQQARNELWQIPLRELNKEVGQTFLNLEPWYEGITDDFYASDQLYAYWVTMLAGAAGYCYGAHGIWNVGDGQFLAHWGAQTFNEAVKLETPQLIGLSHRELMRHSGITESSVQTRGDELICISRSGAGEQITFYPDAALARHNQQDQVWLPLEGRFSRSLPQSGPVVILARTVSSQTQR